MAQEDRDLLEKLEQIFDHDPLIDEVGFLHSSQFQALDCDSEQHAQPDSVGLDKRFLWCKDHKLAISADALPRLYRAAKQAFFDSRNRLSGLVELHSSEVEDISLAYTDLMRHSRILLILSPDFVTAWNSRKLFLSKNNKIPFYKDELQFSTLVLSNSPKSEYSWCHRRWVVKKVAENSGCLHEIIEKESELVKMIAERSKMNYRAWRHRCWITPYMTIAQVVDELDRSRRWAELHVADSCIFHLRTRLLLAVVDHDRKVGESCYSSTSARGIWKEELNWNKRLVTRYKGREALWAHRRFLSKLWIEYFILNQVPQTLEEGTSWLDAFLGEEIEVLLVCVNAPVDEFEETRVQAQLATLYMLWIYKEVPATRAYILCSLPEVWRAENIFEMACPGKILLWKSLMDQLAVT